VTTHLRKASTEGSGGTGDHGEVAAAVPGGDEVLDDPRGVAASSET
jgi:hypothetical protein